MLYGLALAVGAALIMGVLPGLKATGKRLSANLQELNGRTGTHLVSAWTTLVVAQVAVAVAVLPAAVVITGHVVQIELTGPTIAAERFVVADLTMSDEPGAGGATFGERQRAVMSRLQEEPGVAAVRTGGIEFDPPAKARHALGVEVASFDIAADLLTVYGTRMLAFRRFDARDTRTSGAVVVNRTFVTQLLDEPNDALGVRFRDAASAAQGPGGSESGWYKIVGVVDDFPGFPRMPGSTGVPTAYHPAAPGDAQVAVLSVRFNGTISDGIAERFRAITAGFDPALQLRRILPLSAFQNELRSVWRSMAWAVALVL